MSDSFEKAYRAGFQDGRNGTPCELTELLNKIEALECDIKEALSYLDNAYPENWGCCGGR